MSIEKHPSDSTEQQLAHKEILALLNAKYQLTLESRKVLINDTLFQVDGYSENPPILCEIYSRIGKMKVAQHNKICNDKSKRIISDVTANNADKFLRDVAFNLCSNPFFDSKLYQALLTKGAYHFENGVIRFSQWSKKMIDENGEKVRPALISIWDELIKNATLEQKLGEGAFHLRNGASGYSQWSDMMVHKYGDRIKPQLKFIWDEIQKDNTLKSPASSKNKAGANTLHPDVNMPTSAVSMHCPNCGNALIEEPIYFCPVCGQDLSKIKTQLKSNQLNIPSKNNIPPAKRLSLSLFKNFLKYKFQLISKASLNDWLEYFWKHILQVIIIMLLLFLVMRQCDFNQNYSTRSSIGERNTGR